MRVVDQLEVIKGELINFSLLRVELEERERVRNSCKLLFQWIHVVLVDVSIAEGMNEFSTLEPTNLGQHARQ